MNQAEYFGGVTGLSSDMASRFPRLGRVEAGSALQRVIRAVRSPFGFNSDLAQRTASAGDGARLGQHQGVRSSSMGVSALRTRERSSSERRSGGRPVVITCETCTHNLSAQEAVSCSGCHKGTHAECQDQVEIGDLFLVEMCFMCTRKVAHWLRIVEAAERRNFRVWQVDNWFRTMTFTAENNEPLTGTSNPALNQPTSVFSDNGYSK